MKLWIIAWTEIIRMTRNRSFYFVLFALPMLLTLILGTALNNLFDTKDRTIEPVRIAVWNEDTGMMQASIREYMEAAAELQYIQQIQTASREETEAQVRSGDADFGLVIPAGFSDSVTAGRPAQWEYIVGRSPVNNTMAENVLDAFIREANTRQAANVVLGSRFTGQGTLSGQPAGEAVSVRSLNKDKPALSAVQYYAASNLIMFLLFGGMMASISLGKERDNHTLSRLGTTPVSPPIILAGKMIGQGILAVLQAVVMIAGTHWLYGVDWGARPVLLAAVVVLGIASSMCIALLVSLLSGSHKTAASLFQALIIVMTLFSGGFTPVSGIMEQIGRFTTSYWASDAIKRIMLDGDLGTIALHLGVLGAITAGLTVLSFGAYRKVGYHE